MPCAGKEPSSVLQKVAQQTFFPYLKMLHLLSEKYQYEKRLAIDKLT
jgi:hypothetical protein